MAKMRQATLIWSQEDQQYLWHDEQDTETISVREEPEAWLKRLTASTSFSFQGREGHLTLLKEARPRGGDGYWYAYRRQGKRTAKKYAGRTADLTAARLEQMARALRCSPKQINQVQSNGDARGTDDGRDRGATDRAGLHQNSKSPSLQTPLLVPKLHLPPLHPLLVPRERGSLCLIARWSIGSRWYPRLRALEKPRWCASGWLNGANNSIFRRWPGFLWMEAITIPCASGAIF